MDRDVLRAVWPQVVADARRIVEASGANGLQLSAADDSAPVVDEERGAVLAADGGEPREVGDHAVHREDAVGDDELAGALGRALELPDSASRNTQSLDA